MSLFLEILFWAMINISTICDYLVWGYQNPIVFVIITSIIWAAWYLIYYLDID